MCGKNLIYRDFAAFWLLNGQMEEWARKGARYSYAGMTRMAEGVRGNRSFLNPDENRSTAPTGT